MLILFVENVGKVRWGLLSILRNFILSVNQIVNQFWICLDLGCFEGIFAFSTHFVRFSC